MKVHQKEKLTSFNKSSQSRLTMTVSLTMDISMVSSEQVFACLRSEEPKMSEMPEMYLPLGVVS